MTFLKIFSAAVCLGILMPAQAAVSPGYYDAMDGKSREALKAAAKQCVQQHQKLNYSDLPIYWEYSDVYPELYENESGDMCKRWWDMYSYNIYLILPGQSAKTSFSANKMQREHAVPKSWWKSNGSVEYTPAYSDMWNLYPSDGPANQAKLNYPLGVVGNSSFDNGCSRVGTAITGQGGGSGKVFEPADEYKGDFARAFFYMATVYDDLPWVVTYMYEQNAWPTLQPWAVNMLLQWSRQDPVSQKEIDRNDEVEKSQGNRNPYVDFPELAEFVWGTRTDETFLLAEQGGQITPPITGDPEIISPVNGEYLDFGQAAEGMAYTRSLRIDGANLTSSLSLRLTGSDRNMFSIATTSIPASSINSGNGYLLPIVYSPTEIGEHTATLMLYDGGLPDGQSIRVTLHGEALQRPVLTALTALPATDVTDTSYTANWTEAPEVVDYYLVSRVRYYGEGAELEIYESAVNSITFTDRDPAVEESYTVVSARLGVLSPTSNSVVVSASGVDEIAAEAPFMVGIFDGGFSVITDGEHTNMRVFEISGRQVLHAPVVTGGDTFTLPRGLYIITTDQSRRPLRLILR